ncbi:MAG TPA: Gfo/Idh/MocA family oxidoreductase [Candidatus Paceibacterota bacterium]|nr:Gfo/Idh/MocA family oxidoreductase [Verrucomicrobiota bacterium]HRZ45814.1 Gfo/Idh/MocA family oxidoreductase [Candidatus Paceibacterota bacterium]HRZ92505.1 Gfo/Idh/MocA family oxidoreductase [Candidatus Paceibacterota bacterium]
MKRPTTIDGGFPARGEAARDRDAARIGRRQFLKRAAQAGALLMAPQVVRGAVVGRDGGVPPSEQILLGAIGIGNRGAYVLSCFLHEPDLRFVAICDVKAVRRQAVKKMADTRYGNSDCATYRDLHDLLARSDIDAVLIATGPNWHATASILAAQAGKDVYCEKPCTKNIAQSVALAEAFRRTGRVFQAGTQRRSLPNFAFAIDLARRGRLGRLQTMHAHPGGLKPGTSGWAPAEAEPSREEVDWDMYLGPAAWRPYNRRWLDGFNFEKGGGMVGGGCLEWGSHCVDLCQWANDADDTAPVEYEPKGDQLHARYANGVRLIMRNDGWLPLGSCPVRFEGDREWVETADNGDIMASSPALLTGKGAKISGYPADFHVRDFLDCVKSRGQPRANADVACQSHIACHAANIALFLGRKLYFDPRKNEFVGDAEANRLRSEALREPWRI